MPLKRCSKDGKSGWKWGDSGACYTGPSGKKKAIAQGVAIEGPKDFAQKASVDEIDEAIACGDIPIHVRAALVRLKHEE